MKLNKTFFIFGLLVCTLSAHAKKVNLSVRNDTPYEMKQVHFVTDISPNDGKVTGDWQRGESATFKWDSAFLLRRVKVSMDVPGVTADKSATQIEFGNYPKTDTQWHVIESSENASGFALMQLR